MLGFVSALSSAVAVMILLMSVLLANLLSVAIEKDKKMDVSTLIYNNKGMQTQTVKPGHGFAFSPTDLLPLRQRRSSFRLYCTYGNNLSFEFAQKYVSFYYIIVKKILYSNDIIAEQPIYEPNSKNNCTVEEVSNGK